MFAKQWPEDEMGLIQDHTRIGGDDAKETNMNRYTQIALAVLTLSGATATVAYAQDRGPEGPRMLPPIEMMDADKSGDITLEEVTKVTDERFATADADKDGKLTVAEVAAEIARLRSERMAERLISRLDTNEDGVLTADEVSKSRSKMFALLDKNDDGKIVKSEMPNRDRGMRKHGKGWFGGNDENAN